MLFTRLNNTDRHNAFLLAVDLSSFFAGTDCALQQKSKCQTSHAVRFAFSFFTKSIM